ncbi:MAG: hypothetical protein LBV70_06125, partial [Candidatus Adiutrix sp.]|nr:hypothetical protein [Candidatus Adiutrix sp.]
IGGYQVNDYFKFRANVNYLPYSRSDTISDVDYKVDLDFFTLGGLADVHPFGGGFRLSAGLYYANLDLSAKGKMADEKTYTIGDNTYTGAELGTWKGSIKYEKIAPFLGLGYGTGAGNDPGLSFSFDLGAMYMGSPKVSLHPSEEAYAAASDRGYDLAADVAKEEQEVKDKIKDYKWYPVLSFGAVYRF